jgi:hypothetical protein
MTDTSKALELAINLLKPNYWMSGSSEGHEGDMTLLVHNAAAVIRALVTERDNSKKLEDAAIHVSAQVITERDDNKLRAEKAEDCVKVLEEALVRAQGWFQDYADSHTAKGDIDKAKRNQNRADDARAALEDKV